MRAVLYLSPPLAAGQLPRMVAAGIYPMLTPASGVRLGIAQAAPAWGADNGCFAQGERFELDRYLAWLEAMGPAAATCLFATAPDVVRDAAATWARSREVLPALRALGYPAALVAQDGIEDSDIDWDAFDVLFVGGSDGWKESEAVRALVAEARRRGVWCHHGRVTTLRRLRLCWLDGYDSVDGTHLSRRPDHLLPILERWLRSLRGQGRLWDGVPA